MGVLGGEENHIVAIYRKFTGPSSFAKNPLAPVPEDGITKPFRRNEGKRVHGCLRVPLPHEFAGENRSASFHAKRPAQIPSWI